jgi:hypothetical protein
MRNVHCDYTLVPPIDTFDAVASHAQHRRQWVPVIRIFGCTPRGAAEGAHAHTQTGQKCCMHIHNVYPYLMIESVFDAEPDEMQLDEFREKCVSGGLVGRYCLSSLEYALRLVRQQQQQLAGGGKSAASDAHRQHIYSIGTKRAMCVQASCRASFNILSDRSTAITLRRARFSSSMCTIRRSVYARYVCLSDLQSNVWPKYL